jgi:hypothetical protein
MKDIRYLDIHSDWHLSNARREHYCYPIPFSGSETICGNGFFLSSVKPLEVVNQTKTRLLSAENNTQDFLQ